MKLSRRRKSSRTKMYAPVSFSSASSFYFWLRIGKIYYLSELAEKIAEIDVADNTVFVFFPDRFSRIRKVP